MKSPTLKEFFQRQTTLLEVDKKGQQKLQNSSVLVVGCGGLGGAIGVHLAASGIGRIHLIDFDTVAISNLHRQVFYTLEDVDKPKAAVLANVIKKRAPFTEVTFSNKAIKKQTVFEAILKADIIVDATDSLPTKYLLNDACVLTNKPLIYGSLYKFDGYVASFNVLEKEGTYSANLRDAFPEMATDIPTCETAGTLNSIVSLIATLQVNEVLKLVLGLEKLLINSLLIYDSLENKQLKIRLKKTVLKEQIAIIFKKELYVNAPCESQNPNWLINSQTLHKAMLSKNKNSLKIVSVIENDITEYPFLVDEKIPLSTLGTHKFKVEKNKQYVMVCQKGISSYKATELLKEQFPKTTIVSLQGGIENYKIQFTD
jgi:molybdopterin/thiamine biosynthesis adenylyltransferase/rhodanese-related sulfurtransferase